MFRPYFLLVLFSIATVNAHAAQDQKKFFKCVRKVSQSWTLKKDEILSLIQTVVDAKSAKEEKPYSRALSTCHDLSDQTKGRNKSNWAEVEKMMDKEVWQEIALKSTHHEAFMTVRKFILPRASCTVGGSRADAVAIVGAGAGASLGFCRSSDGRRWGIVRGEASLNFGVGADLMLFVSQLGFEYDPGGEWFQISRNNELLVAGLGLMFVMGENSNYEDSITALGLGAGIHINQGAAITLKLLPLGSNMSDFY